jgi:hypothetical protein
MSTSKRNKPDSPSNRRAGRPKRLSFPLSVEDALRGAMQTGKPPEPENKHAKRTATKRRLKGDQRDKARDDR